MRREGVEPAKPGGSLIGRWRLTLYGTVHAMDGAEQRGTMAGWETLSLAVSYVVHLYTPAKTALQPRLIGNTLTIQ
jgi:hypothetical protein